MTGLIIVKTHNVHDNIILSSRIIACKQSAIPYCGFYCRQLFNSKEQLCIERFGFYNNLTGKSSSYGITFVNVICAILRHLYLFIGSCKCNFVYCFYYAIETIFWKCKLYFRFTNILWKICPMHLWRNSHHTILPVLTCLCYLVCVYVRTSQPIGLICLPNLHKAF